MAELQRTFAGELVPTQDLGSDLVECQDLLGLDRYQERDDCYAVRIPLFPPDTPTTTPETLSIADMRERLDKGEFSGLSVSVSDSVATGNCAKGTRGFLKSLGLSGNYATVGDLWTTWKEKESLLSDRYGVSFLSTLSRILSAKIRPERPAILPIGETVEYFYYSQNAEERESQVSEEISDYHSEIFHHYFSEREAWVEEYHTSEEYIGDLFYIVGEGDRGEDKIREILEDQDNRETLGIPPQANLSRDFLKLLADNLISDGLTFEISGQYEMASWNYVDSFTLGDLEDQVDIDDMERELEGRLYYQDSTTTFDDILEEYLGHQRDHYIDSRHARGKYRELSLTVSSDSRIDFVLDLDCFERIYNETVIEFCRRSTPRKGS